MLQTLQNEDCQHFFAHAKRQKISRPEGGFDPATIGSGVGSAAHRTKKADCEGVASCEALYPPGKKRRDFGRKKAPRTKTRGLRRPKIGGNTAGEQTESARLGELHRRAREPPGTFHAPKRKKTINRHAVCLFLTNQMVRPGKQPAKPAAASSGPPKKTFVIKKSTKAFSPRSPGARSKFSAFYLYACEHQRASSPGGAVVGSRRLAT